MNKSIINQLKEKKGYILFMAAYILFLLYKIIYNSTFHEILNPSIIRYIKFATWGMFAFKIILDIKEESKKTALIELFLVLLACVIRFCSGSSEIFELLIVILAAQNIEFKTIAKVTLREVEIICGMIIVSSLVGIIPNYEFVRASGEYKKAFGFNYVSKMPMYFLHILFLKLYLYESEKKVAKNWELILLFILSTVIFYLTYVRIPYVLSILFIVLYMMVVKYKKINLYSYKKVLQGMFIGCFLIALFLVCTFHANQFVYQKLDQILSSRLTVMNRVLGENEVALFGKKVEMKAGIGLDYTYVDSAYIATLLRDGYVGILLVIMYYTYLLKVNIEHQNTTITIWLMLLAISSIADDALLQINLNCAILSIFTMIPKHKKEQPPKIEGEIE